MDFQHQVFFIFRDQFSHILKDVCVKYIMRQKLFTVIIKNKLITF